VRECTRTLEKHKGCKLSMPAQCGDETCPCFKGCGRADCKTCSAPPYYVAPQRSGEAAGPSRGGDVDAAAGDTGHTKRIPGDRGTAGRADAGRAGPSRLDPSRPILARRSGDVSSGDTDSEDYGRGSLEMLEQGEAALIPTGGVPDRSRQALRSAKNRMGACCRIS
jgi:hypothetical protein